ncbi:hypothetical protein IGU62_001769 [Escherichia coli]|uniref:hypothetical protein n=1 Tax=Escherichia coli TaxID=562 RepID=UPI0010581FF9|nr:hypothetical protein [Escherichia coli]EFL9656579.1 hypothetical protein [Escherichia coli]EGL8705276.1 hypothetical protein [Escherichia coli]NJU52831.1 hypothetical protein [Escherichia coli]NJU85823.1 hypothetical protein [Escherichia coli]HBJ0846690.1 hypothetical protein [Escherichia coli]
MAQGLQCWDASGRLVVDLGDYNMRFMGTASLAIAAGTTNVWTVNFTGVRPTGWLIIPVSNSFSEFYCVPQTNSFSVRYTPTGGISARTLSFELYAFE